MNESRSQCPTSYVTSYHKMTCMFGEGAVYCKHVMAGNQRGSSVCLSNLYLLFRSRTLLSAGLISSFQRPAGPLLLSPGLCLPHEPACRPSAEVAHSAVCPEGAFGPTDMNDLNVLRHVLPAMGFRRDAECPVSMPGVDRKAGIRGGKLRAAARILEWARPSKEKAVRAPRMRIIPLTCPMPPLEFDMVGIRGTGQTDCIFVMVTPRRPIA
jgi:hypothetical protein